MHIFGKIKNKKSVGKKGHEKELEQGLQGFDEHKGTNTTIFI